MAESQREVRLDLSFDSDAPAVARRFVADHADSLPEALIDDAELLVSELVTNAVQHGCPAITLQVRTHPPRIGISVHDEGAAVPPEQPVPAPPSATQGRGLLLVDKISSEWGVTPSDPPPGKTVWFELSAAATTPR
jgi:anti-sigma regulatory factor (Ser/Thr protein kinase)